MTKEDLEIIQIEIDKAIAELFWQIRREPKNTDKYDKKQRIYEHLNSGKWRTGEVDD